MPSKSKKPDDIYIDCQPVDDDDTNALLDPNSDEYKMKQRKFSLNRKAKKQIYQASAIIGGVVIMYGLYKIGTKLINKAKE